MAKNRDDIGRNGPVAFVVGPTALESPDCRHAFCATRRIGKAGGLR